MTSSIQHTASPYQRLLHELQHTALCEEQQWGRESLTNQRLQELQSYWSLGLLGTQAMTAHHGMVRLIDFGQWSREGIYDIERAQIEIEGQWCSGAIMFTACASDWERLGYADDPRYDHVILHVSAGGVPPHWYTRTSKLRHVPYLALDELHCQQLLQLPPTLDYEQLELCEQPLQGLSSPQLQTVLLSAAAHRLLQKRHRFVQRASILGKSQCWYEAWAEALGYYRNRFAMRVLAQRAPLNLVRDMPAEALLFGMAGFLTAVLPASCEEEVRSYHRQVWDQWWTLRDEYELRGRHALSWDMSHTRPANHPHRRIAALAATVQRWDEWESLLKAESLPELQHFAASLEHPYWTYHTSLPSARLRRSTSLIGKQRLNAFLINSLLVFDESELAWQLYQQQRETSIPSKVKKLAAALAGDRADLNKLLNNCAIQQGLLQIGSDFASETASSSTRKALFPEPLAEIAHP